ncbi:MAG: hypothetical protein WDM86_05200 [Rhizomicrobium sp.]
MHATSLLTADDLCRIAADLVDEHGIDARDYARRAVLCLEAEGARDRAQFWQTLCVLLDDIAENRLDPLSPVTLH